MKPLHVRFLSLCFAAMLAMSGHCAFAQEGRFEVGGQGLVLLSQGEPSNDMVGGGVVFGWRWKDQWHFGGAIDDMTFDYERPQRELGIVQDPAQKVIDGSNSFTRLSGWVERRYDDSGNWHWFWGAGLGYASITAEPFVSGPTNSGGTFNITTDASDELHLMTRAGLRRALGDNWTLTGTFHLEHHFTDYMIRDTVSGAVAKIESHTPVGLSLTFGYRF